MHQSKTSQMLLYSCVSDICLQSPKTAILSFLSADAIDRPWYRFRWADVKHPLHSLSATGSLMVILYCHNSISVLITFILMKDPLTAFIPTHTAGVRLSWQIRLDSLQSYLRNTQLSFQFSSEMIHKRYIHVQSPVFLNWRGKHYADAVYV